MLSSRATAGTIAVLAAAVALAGDACHVTSGTVVYDRDWPAIWHSAFWFPFAVGLGFLALARTAERLPWRPARLRTRVDIPAGLAAVLALYAVTAVLRHQPTTVSVVLTGALAVLVWAWWDPSLRSLLVGLAAAVLGPLTEIALAHAGLAHYAADADGLWGVAPWLPSIYLAGGAVSAQLWSAVQGSR